MNFLNTFSFIVNKQYNNIFNVGWLFVLLGAFASIGLILNKLKIEALSDRKSSWFINFFNSSYKFSIIFFLLGSSISALAFLLAPAFSINSIYNPYKIANKMSWVLFIFSFPLLIDTFVLICYCLWLKFYYLRKGHNDNKSKLIHSNNIEVKDSNKIDQEFEKNDYLNITSKDKKLTFQIFRQFFILVLIITICLYCIQFVSLLHSNSIFWNKHQLWILKIIIAVFSFICYLICIWKIIKNIIKPKIKFIDALILNWKKIINECFFSFVFLGWGLAGIALTHF